MSEDGVRLPLIAADVPASPCMSEDRFYLPMSWRSRV